MSFLQDEIGPILTEIRNDPGNSVQIASKIDNYKAKIEEKLNTLSKNNNLRIFDNEKGGVLAGPVDNRKKYEQLSENGLTLLCNQRYMKHGRNNLPSEVPYMRALFNGRSLAPYSFIAYETPLMRKKEKGTTEISGREVSCDLLGINDNEICCIELKTVPDSAGTILPYAILEGFAYATCLEWLRQNYKDEILKEINLCCKRVKVGKPAKTPEKVTFAVAGPEKDYFRPYINKLIENRNHTKEWFKRRIDETEVLENIPLINNFFAGYFVLSAGINDIKDKNISQGVIEPNFSKQTLLIKKAAAFNQL